MRLKRYRIANAPEGNLGTLEIQSSRCFKQRRIPLLLWPILWSFLCFNSLNNKVALCLNVNSPANVPDSSPFEFYYSVPVSFLEQSAGRAYKDKQPPGVDKNLNDDKKDHPKVKDKSAKVAVNAHVSKVSSKDRRLYNPHPFKPAHRHTFKHVSLDHDEEILSLYDKDGYTIGSFVYPAHNRDLVHLLAEMTKNNSNDCNISWFPTTAKKNEGHIKFSCKGDIATNAFSGETPILITIEGVSRNKSQNIFLSSSGFTFAQQYPSLHSIKHAIMLALGTEPTRDCEITRVNGRHYKSDNETYNAIMAHVRDGVKVLKLTVRPKIRVVGNVQEPFAKGSGGYNQDFGDLTVKEYNRLLSDDRNLVKLAKSKLNSDADGFILSSVNGENVVKRGAKSLSKIPLEMDVKWTFTPDVTVWYHFLGGLVGSSTFHSSTKIKDVVKRGSQLLRRELHKHLMYKLYSYGLPGCLEEEIDSSSFLKKYGDLPLHDLPFSANCANTQTHFINFHYFNEKPEEFHFEVEIENPDGSHNAARKIVGKYVADTTLGDIKDAILEAFEKAGTVISKESLKFLNLFRSDLKEVNDKTKLNSLKDIPNDQKLGRTSKLVLKAEPKIKGIFINPNGTEEKMDIRLNTIFPSLDDIKTSFENELHTHNLLKPDETIHGPVKVHPIGRHHKVNKKVDVRVDEKGHFLPGTRANAIAAEADSRVELPVVFTGDDGKVINIKVHIPYGSTPKQIEQLVKGELEQAGYSTKLPNVSISLNGKDDIDLSNLWDHNLENNPYLKVQPAKVIDVEGRVGDVPTHFNLKVHAHENMDELEHDVLRSLEKSPNAEKWLKSDPKHLEEITAMVMAENGDTYSDDVAGDQLYRHTNTIRLSVADHPLDLFWRNPLTGADAKFCISRRADGRCRGLSPTILSKFTIQTIGDFLVNIIKKQNGKMYDEEILGLVKKNKGLSSTVKLADIVLVNGQILPCNDVRPTDTLPILEQLYGFDSGHISGLVFTLMTQQEQAELLEEADVGGKIHIKINKTSGEPESHNFDLEDLGPSDLENSVYKYFSSVPYGTEIKHLFTNGKPVKSADDIIKLSKRYKKSKEPLIINFDIDDDHKAPPHLVTVKNGKVPVRIQPKYNETIRDYFLRAQDEPGDFGLTAFHSYQVSCVDQNGNLVDVDGLLDVPISQLKQCKELVLHEQPANRMDEPIRVTVHGSTYRDVIKEPLVLDQTKDNINSLNNKLRTFLMSIPDDELDHVIIKVNDREIKCSLAALNDAYKIKYLTLDTLMGICNIHQQGEVPPVIMLNIDAKPDDFDKRSKTVQYLNVHDQVGQGTKPMVYFTLHKGQNDLGVGAMVEITSATLKSAVLPLYQKLLGMFGKSLHKINGIQLSVVKNGRSFPCNNARKLHSLAHFKNVPLMDILKMCNIPPHVPHLPVFYHFHVAIPFAQDIGNGFGIQMGGYVPGVMSFKDDEMMSTIGYDEDLSMPLYNFVHDNPDVDLTHLNRYHLTIKSQEPNNKVHSKSYRLDQLPSRMSLNTIFPHTHATNVSFQLDDEDDMYSTAGDWRTELAYPVNDYLDSFDDIRNQLIVNLKSMHGKDLRNLQGYNVLVNINGEKHQCHIKSLAELETMDLASFMQNCVNIEHVGNNPMMSFAVNYDSFVKTPQFMVTCYTNDMQSVASPILGPDSPLPSSVVNALTKKYGKTNVASVVWTAFINGMQGDCHINDITSSFTMKDLLEACGVNGDGSNRYVISLYDISLDYIGPLVVEPSGTQGLGGGIPMPHELGTSPLVAPSRHLIRQNATLSGIQPNVFLNMPASYHGDQIKIDGHNSLNDYTRRILLDEDTDSPGRPINIKMNMNGHSYHWGDIPIRELNYPTGHMNGNISFVVNDDESGSLPGTFMTFHFPEKDKPLFTFLKGFKQRIPDIAGKRLMLITPKSMIPEAHIPRHLLTTPVKDLNKAGYFFTLVNDPRGDVQSAPITVNILTKNGVNTNAQVLNLQQPLFQVFSKMSSELDPETLADAKFRLIIDGIDTNCTVPALNTLLTRVTLQDVLSRCGIYDFQHGHNLMLYLDTDLGGPHGKSAHGFKLDVKLDDRNDFAKNVDFGYNIDIGQGPMNFLKQKPNTGIFFDFKGQGGFREFIEVDTEKFRRLLQGHPSIVDLLLKLGVPHDHMGGVESLQIILSTLSKALEGHQLFSVNTLQDTPFADNEPISKHESIKALTDVLLRDKEQNVKVTVSLANGNQKEFVVPNNEFLHAIRGNLTFKDVALWGIPSADASHITRVHFDTAPVPEALPVKRLRGHGHAGGVNFGHNRALQPSHGGSARAGVITTKTKLSDIDLVGKAVNDQDRNVLWSVNTRGGKNLDIIIKSSMLKDYLNRGLNVTDVLTNFMTPKDISNISGISLKLESRENRKFFVPLKRHEPVVMPVVASDEPQKCMIQEFKNPWNPPEATWKKLTIRQAVDAYLDHYRIPQNKHIYGLYLLRKEAMNNISAEVLYDDLVKPDESMLDRKLGDFTDVGCTLFVRLKNTGELAI